MKYLKYLLASIALISSVSAGNGKCGPGVGVCPSGQCCSKYGWCGTTNDHCKNGCQSEFGKCLGNEATTKKTTTRKTTTKKTTTKKTTTKKTTTKKPVKTNNAVDIKYSTDGTCGPDHGICPNDSCCSKYGYCGTSEAHCGSGCQSEFGKCNSKSSTTKKTTATTTTTTKKTTTTTKKTTTTTRKTTTTTKKTTTTTKKTTTTTKKTTTTTTKKSTPTSNKKISTNGLCGGENGSCPNNQCCSQYGFCGKSDEYCGAGCQSEFGNCGEVSEEIIEGFGYYDSCKDKKHWALTFDDGPYSYDLDLLKLLRDKGVKATFFINGANVMDITTSEGKKIIQQMNKDGHVIGSHTWGHKDLSTLSSEEIVEQMVNLEEWIYKYTEKKPAFLRPPYGGGNGDPKIAEILKDLGYTAACMWNVDTKDWENKGNIDFALGEFKNTLSKGGIISLNHSFYEGITKDKLLNLIEAEIDYMKSQGYTPVTMDKCIGLKANK